MDVPVTRPAPSATHAERPIATWNGFLMLGVGLAFLLVAVWQVISMVGAGRPTLGAVGLVVLWFVLGVIALSGLYTLQPNTAAILQLFGDYRGTSRVPGLRFTNPFYSNRKLSLRARNLNGERLKVNDKRGNPIEIAAVVVWHVHDTARAAFEVDDYENFVKVQSEAAVRHLASSFAYDEDDTSGEPAGPTLLGSSDVVAAALVHELQARLSQAGVVYGCGPMAMLRSVTDIAAAHGAVAQVAVEESMACGVGVCMTCVMPVTGNDGVTRMVRSCVEGPVFRGDRVRWDAFGDGIGRVPDDALGAPRAGGH